MAALLCAPCVLEVMGSAFSRLEWARPGGYREPLESNWVERHRRLAGIMDGTASYDDWFVVDGPTGFTYPLHALTMLSGEPRCGMHARTR